MRVGSFLSVELNRPGLWRWVIWTYPHTTLPFSSFGKWHFRRQTFLTGFGDILVEWILPNSAGSCDVRPFWERNFERTEKVEFNRAEENLRFNIHEWSVRAQWDYGKRLITHLQVPYGPNLDRHDLQRLSSLDFKSSSEYLQRLSSTTKSRKKDPFPQTELIRYWVIMSDKNRAPVFRHQLFQVRA